MRDSKSERAEIRDPVHLCIDMQNIFAPGGLWATPWMERVLPTVAAIASRYRARTIFTRFITPQQPHVREALRDLSMLHALNPPSSLVSLGVWWEPTRLIRSSAHAGELTKL
ncbi:nicotinamidase-related amidase [Bradyrhizobium sp. LB8.2]